MKQAKEAAEKAYAPYSAFSVGAALLAKSGAVYLGANMENGSYGATICAERAAFLQAVLQGEREFEAIAIYSPKEERLVPCGMCLQTMQEFCNGDFLIYTSSAVYRLSELLPYGFSLREEQKHD